MTPWHWLELGRFRVLARPLPGNPVWLTHWIYARGELIGKQLSVPTMDDCRFYERGHGAYAQPTRRSYGYTAVHARRRAG